MVRGDPDFLRTGQLPPQPTLIEDAAVKEELVSFENHMRKVVLFHYMVTPLTITPYMLEYVAGREKLMRGVRVLSPGHQSRIPTEKARSRDRQLVRGGLDGHYCRLCTTSSRGPLGRGVGRIGERPGAQEDAVITTVLGRTRSHADAEPTAGMLVARVPYPEPDHPSCGGRLPFPTATTSARRSITS